jgi:hypothetical protein
MSTFSSNGEVFGAKVLYGLIIALSAAVLFGAVASTMPMTGGSHATAAAPHTVETATAGSHSGGVS